MVQAMVRELQLQQQFLRDPVETVYFGGGTPSLLSSDQLGSLLDEIQQRFRVIPGAEITLEANPDDLSHDILRALRQIGVNRLSIGIQSFDDKLLTFLHRAHDARTANACLERSVQAGFNNISIDLIYGIPGLDLEAWRKTIQHALVYRPAHISMYALTLEERTVFGNWLKRKKIIPAEEESVAEQFELMQNLLEDSGYEHYEISNFCLPGMHSRHNSSYWLQQPYLGIGPSAHSYDGDRRYFNIRNNANYVKAITEGRVPAESELLTRENRINEYLLTRLRTRWGCDLTWLQTHLQEDLMVRHKVTISRYIDQGLLVSSGNFLHLSRRGKLLADQITEDLMV